MMAIFAILLCWTISFFFAGIEAGLLAVDPVRLRSQVKRGRPSAKRLNNLLKNPERLLVTVLFVTNVADIVALIILTQRLVWRFGSSGYWLSLLIAVPVYLFALAVLPKSLFRRFPFRALALLAGVLELASLLLWPLLQLGSLIGRFVLPREKNRHARLFAAREELKHIAAQSEREGSLTATERAMINNVVDFRSVRVRDVMVPLANIVAIEPDTPVDTALEISREKSVDRLPVITRDRQAIGLVNTLEILLDKERPRTIRQSLRRIVTARENEPGYLIVQRLRAARLGLAAVVDRQQNLIGIVTIEDLIRRLVSLSEARP